ncbi:Myblike DNAbinding domain-containing protein, partial [Blomia tropicalis]
LFNMTTPQKLVDEKTNDINIEIDKSLEHLQNALKLNSLLTEYINEKRLEFIEKRDDNEVIFDNIWASTFNDDIACEEIDGSNSGLLFTKKFKFVSLLPFFKPYFRDKKGLSAPKIYPDRIENDFVQNLVLLLQTPHQNRNWSNDENEILLREIRSQYVQAYTSKLVLRLETLLEKAPAEKPPELDILKSNWTVDEDERLQELVTLHGTNNWDLVAQEFGKGRLPWQCCSRYQSELNKSMRRLGRIEGEEAEIILKIIEQYKFGSTINWINVSCLIEGRTLQQIQHFYNKLQNPTIIRKWSKLEDKMILAGVQLFKNKWELISQFFPLRNNRQVRDRYQNQLAFSQERKFGDWTEPEDELILEMSTKYLKYSTNGNTVTNFPEIQRLYFPNRNVYQVYRRYLYLKKKLPESAFTTQLEPLNDVDCCPSIYQDMFQNRKTRRRFRSKKTAQLNKLVCQFPNDKGKLLQYMVNGKKRLQASAKLKTPSSKLDELEDSMFKNKPGKDNPITKVVEIIDLDTEISNKEFDKLLSMFVSLQDLRYKSKCTFMTELDLNANAIMQLVLYELIDPSTNDNLILQSNLLRNDENDEAIRVSTSSESNSHSKFDSIVANESEPELIVKEVVKRRGRPPKRSFHHNTEIFFRVRSYQANVLLTNTQLVNSELLINTYPFDGSQYWLHEPIDVLENRVSMFIEFIWNQVDQLFDQKKTNKKAKIDNSKSKKKKLQNNY